MTESDNALCEKIWSWNTNLADVIKIVSVKDESEYVLKSSADKREKELREEARIENVELLHLLSDAEDKAKVVIQEASKRENELKEKADADYNEGTNEGYNHGMQDSAKEISALKTDVSVALLLCEKKDADYLAKRDSADKTADCLRQRIIELEKENE